MSHVASTGIAVMTLLAFLALSGLAATAAWLGGSGNGSGPLFCQPATPGTATATPGTTPTSGGTTTPSCVPPGNTGAKVVVWAKAMADALYIGPTRANYKWQARQETGFDASQFLIDWHAEQATCPEGHGSLSWTPAIDRRKNEVIKIKFSTKDCQACPSLRLCTHSVRHVRRTVTIRPQQQYYALQARRQEEMTKDFKKLYAMRAGVEGTLSQGVRTMGMRRSRYIGQERTHLQHVATAAAINIVRLMRWLDGEPHAKTKRSPFVQLHRPAV
jgi:transposase